MTVFPSVGFSVRRHQMMYGLVLVVLMLSGWPGASLADFTVLGTEGAWLQQNSRVTSGDVGVNTLSVGPFLSDGVELTFGPGGRVDSATSVVYGNRVSLNISAQVFDLHTNQVSGIGTILGQTITPLTLPVVSTLPAIPAITPGTQVVNVPLFSTQTLGPGNYAEVTVGTAGTLTLTGGLYEITSLSVGNSAKVHIAAPTELRITGRVHTEPIARLEPAPGTTLTAADILVVATGQNGTTGGLTESPKAVSFGQATTLRAKVWAPNGTVELQQNSVGTGAFVGKWVILGPGVFANFEGGFGLTVGGGGGNTPPVADAGPDQTVQVTNAVQLDGSDSTDVDGDLLTFSWTLVTQPAGSTATLDDATLVMPTLVADAPGSYEIELVVNDGTVNSAPDTVTITTSNSPPVADAGPDQTVFVTQTVLLNGTNSSDVDQDPLTFQWIFIATPSGSTATLSDPTSPTPDFPVDLPGIYEVQLIVNDGTENSAPDTVVIDTQNSKPVANAEPDQTVPIGSIVQLDGSNSNDVDGDPLTYLWALIAMPTNSTALLSDVTLINPTFVADLPGIYVVQLIVNDGNEDSDPTTVTITTANTPPIAEAGSDQTVPVGTLVQLDGSASNDVEGTPLTFLWALTTQPSGSAATLSDATLVNPTFLADVPGSYVVTLMVNDGTDDSAPDTVLITTANTPPVANAGLDQTVVPGSTVQLDGSGSSDPESDPLTYQWSLLSTPVSSAATLSNATLVNPTFVADLAGSYVIQLIVDDGLVPSTPNLVVITGGNGPPVLNPIGNQTIPLGTALNLTLSGTDPNGDPMIFSALPLPLPIRMVLEGTTGVVSWRPSLEQVGVHTITFVVSDGIFTDEETITVTVQGPAPGGVTGISGRILDTNDFVTNSIDTPIVGATVSILGHSGSATTDAQGFFTLTDIPSGQQVFAIDSSGAAPAPDGSGYAGFRERIELEANVTNLIDRAFYLPRIDPNSQMTVNGIPVTQVDPNNTTVVTNAALGAILTVPPHSARNIDGSEYTGALTLSEVPGGLTPAALPAFLELPSVVVTIQPPGVIFATLASLTLPNTLNAVPGFEFDLWSLDPGTGTFIKTGRNKITPDGTQMEPISGGVRATDWFCPFPPLGGSASSSNSPNNECKVESGSQTAPCSGALTVEHDLAGYQSVSANRVRQLVYRSQSANPAPTVSVTSFSGSVNPPPTQMAIELRLGSPDVTVPNLVIPADVGVPSTLPPPIFQPPVLGGVSLGEPIFTDVENIQPPLDRDNPIVQSFQIPEIGNVPTGSYPLQVINANYWGNTFGGFPIVSTGIQQTTVFINNERDSPLGAGWTIKELSRLHLGAPDRPVLTKGDGSTLTFSNPLPGSFVAPLTIPLPSGFSDAGGVVAELNGDAFLDLVVPLDGQLEILLGNGAASFLTHTPADSGGGVRQTAVMDMNQDGHADILNLVNANAISVLLGDGTGSFAAPSFVNIPAIPEGQPFVESFTLGDFNQDTQPDVATLNVVFDSVLNKNVLNVMVFLGDGAGNFAMTSTALLPTTFDDGQGMIVSDHFTGDDNRDVVVALASPDAPTLLLLAGDGAGAVSLSTSLAVPSLPAFFGGSQLMAVGDVNADGSPDVVLGGADAVKPIVTVLLNNRVGGFWPGSDVPAQGLTVPDRLVLGDINEDGFLDLVTTGDRRISGSDEETVNIYQGDGTGNFLPIGEVPDFYGLGLALGDVDNNGTRDVILLPRVGEIIQPATVAILLNSPESGITGGGGQTFRSPAGDFSTLVNNVDGTFTRRFKDGKEVEFSVEGLQTAVKDRNGNTTVYQYDGDERLTSITDPAGLVTQFVYAGAQLDHIVDPANRTTQFAYDGANNLVTITDPDLSERHFTYNAQHLMTTQTSKRGLMTEYDYNFSGHNVEVRRPDGSSRLFTPAEAVGLVDPSSGLGTETNPAPPIRPSEVLATVTDGNGEERFLQFDPFGAATNTTDALGRTTLIERNADGLPTKRVTPNGAETQMSYDDRGNVITLVEAVGTTLERTTSFQYDQQFNQLIQQTDPAGKVTTIQLDSQGNPERIINPLLDDRVRTFTSEGLVETDQDENGQVTTFTYDLKGNLETLIDAETHVTRFIRDAAGNVTTLIEGEGTPEQRTRTFTYDEMNRLKTATDGTANPPTQFAYDVQGNLTATTLPTGEQEIRAYDPQNRVSTINDPLRGLTTFAYDPNGNLEETVNAADDSTNFAYDEANQLETITDALTGVQAFTYDVEGNVETFTDARQKTTTFVYDLLNRQTSRISQGGTFTTTFTYDSRDNLFGTVDPKGQTITRFYDDLSRLTSMFTPGNNVALAYDAVGNLLEIRDSDSQVIYTYDGLNRVKTAETSQDTGLQPNVLLTSVYDAVGNRTQLDEDAGTSVTNYLHDLAGRLTKVTPPAGATTEVTLGYDPAGRLASLAYPNGVTTAYGYDSKGRLDSLRHTLGGNPSFASFGYTYNPVGNILDILDQVNPSETRNHTYDALQRLKTGGAVANAETYDYDLVGNRTTSFLSTSHAHDDLNRLLEDDQFTYTYDNNGNLETKTNKTNPTEVTTYHWDAQDQLIQIDRPDTTTVTYKYDGLGRRIEKNVDSTITRYVYDGGDILLEYDGTNTFVARYSFGEQVDQPLVLQKAGVGFFYYHSNHQGSITHLTDSTGTVANSYAYDSYGRRLTVFESVIQPFSYTGREYDAESGFYFYRARYYDASTGRFLSEDPIGLDGGDQNIYRYVSNSPLMLNDPFGLAPDCTETGRGRVITRSDPDNKVIIQEQFTIPGAVPEGPSEGMTFDLRNPRVPPRATQRVRIIEIEVIVGVEEVFNKIKVTQDIFFDCEEEREGPCGEKEIFKSKVKINKVLSETREFIGRRAFQREVSRRTVGFRNF